MSAILVRLSDDTTTRLDVAHDPPSDVNVHLPTSPERTVIIGLTLDRQEGESEWACFLVYKDREDHSDAWRDMYGEPGSKTPAERIFITIMSNDTLEPELPVKRINLDGASVLEIDLQPHFPDHVLWLPERYVV